jgi:hypothetical protein
VGRLGPRLPPVPPEHAPGGRHHPPRGRRQDSRPRAAAPDPGAAVRGLERGLRRHGRARPALGRGHGPGAPRAGAAGRLRGVRSGRAQVRPGGGFELDMRREGAQDRARRGS